MNWFVFVYVDNFRMFLCIRLKCLFCKILWNFFNIFKVFCGNFYGFLNDELMLFWK